MPRVKDQKKRGRGWHSQGIDSYGPVQSMTPHTPVQRFIPGAPVKEIPSVKKLGVIERADTDSDIHACLENELKRVGKNIMDVDFNPWSAKLFPANFPVGRQEKPKSPTHEF